MIKSNDDERVQRALENLNLDDEAARTARMFALLILVFGGGFGVVLFAFIISLLSQ